MVADHRGGWTQILDGKASKLETSRPVEKRKFYLPQLHLAPPLGVIPSEFRRDLLHYETRVLNAFEEWWDILLSLHCKFTAKFVSERILTIGQYLAKLGTKI